MITALDRAKRDYRAWLRYLEKYRDCCFDSIEHSVGKLLLNKCCKEYQKMKKAS